jgi:hypothetical protein
MAVLPKAVERVNLYLVNLGCCWWWFPFYFASDNELVNSATLLLKMFATRRWRPRKIEVNFESFAAEESSVLTQFVGTKTGKSLPSW